MAFYKDPTLSRVLVVTFRATELKSGEDYTVEIPAGAIGLAKNTSKTNGAITLHFKGRDDVPVKLTKAFPVDNAEIARIDNTGNPVYLTFDTKVKVSDAAAASLVQIDGAEEKTICKMNVVTSFDNGMVALVPAATQYLYSGAKYKVVLAKGSLTDMSGSEDTGNEEIVLNYSGTYERQISTDDANLFFDDFSSIGLYAMRATTTLRQMKCSYGRLMLTTSLGTSPSVSRRGQTSIMLAPPLCIHQPAPATTGSSFRS